AKVVDLEPLLVTGEIAERDIDRIRIDQPVGVRFVGGGETTGVVSYVSKVSSNTARTFRIEVTVDNANGRLGEGLTTELRLETGSVRAHRVTPAILTLSDDGVVGVKAVDADGRVLFHKATVVADEPGGVWLGGLPESLTLITIGQEFVRIGQVVKPVEEKAGAKQ
ncbi:MAG: efflux RND transporter periplasmic adaptor subunit, partial [Rhodospirillales bacterium]|nr:efflux RND transporter periplasmic adaptor subunit [Rhodospirillales bacterium]